MKKTTALIAVAGLASFAAAQSATLVFSADKTSAALGEDVTWTVSIEFDNAGNADLYVFGTNLHLLSSTTGSNDGIVAGVDGSAAGTTFYGGNADGAGIDNIRFSDLAGTGFGHPGGGNNPFILGSFVARADAGATWTFDAMQGTDSTSAAISLASGGIISPPFTQVDFSDAGDFAVVSDTVALPTPASLALVGLGGLVATRRRR